MSYGCFSHCSKRIFGASFSPTFFQRQVKNQGLGEKGLMEVEAGGGRVKKEMVGSGAHQRHRKGTRKTQGFL